jgi:drug/metabolite transporter (DMT)-like permease
MTHASATPHTVAPRLWLGPVLVLTGGVFIGLAPIGLRAGLSELGPQAIAFWRYSFAIPILFAAAFLVRRRLPRRPGLYVVLAGVCFALDIALWHAALTITTVSNATFIVNLGSIGLGFMAWLFLKERPPAVWFFALPIAAAGAAGLAFGGGAAGQSRLEGDVLALAAAFMVGAYLLFSKLARARLSGLEVIFWVTCVEVIVAAVIVALAGEPFFPERPEGFLAPLFLAVFVQVLGQGCILIGIGRTPAAIAGVLILIQPVVAAALSWQIFGETLSALQAAGAAGILAAVWLAQHRSRPPVPA